MICIKTGMASEEAIAKTYAPKDAIVLSGVLDHAKLLPMECKGIISFGLCGGLAPDAQIGQAFIYDTIQVPAIYGAIRTPASDIALPCDDEWRKNLFALTRYYECKCWSSGDFNTANTIAQRAKLYRTTGCEVIDDESFAVAEFALRRGMKFIGLRVVSDGAEDNLPPAVMNALHSDGSANIWAVIESLFTEPIDPLTKQLQIGELFKTIGEYEKSIAELRTAAIAISKSKDWGLS